MERHLGRALAAIVAALVIGLIGIAIGAAKGPTGEPLLHWSDFGFWPLVFSVAGSFFAFVIGGWVTGKIAGLLRAETAMLHGAIVWLLAVPILFGLIAIGGGGFFGGWFGGLAGTPAWVTPHAVATGANAAIAARNSALGALAGLLLGLVGAVIGG